MSERTGKGQARAIACEAMDLCHHLLDGEHYFECDELTETITKALRQAYMNAALAATMALGFDAPPRLVQAVAGKIADRRDEHLAAVGERT